MTIFALFVGRKRREEKEEEEGPQRAQEVAQRFHVLLEGGTRGELLFLRRGSRAPQCYQKACGLFKSWKEELLFLLLGRRLLVPCSGRKLDVIYNPSLLKLLRTGVVLLFEVEN